MEGRSDAGALQPGFLGDDLWPLSQFASLEDSAGLRPDPFPPLTAAAAGP